jgi:hypothetical protein
MGMYLLGGYCKYLLEMGVLDKQFFYSPEGNCFRSFLLVYSMNKMLKNAIAPIQAWLMSQGRCVGCGKPLSEGKSVKHKHGTKKVTCSCGRIFIYDPKKKTHRRALLEEV